MTESKCCGHDLAAKIMNLRTTKHNEPKGLLPAYRRGHRDARHAAAELASEAASKCCGQCGPRDAVPAGWIDVTGAFKPNPAFRFSRPVTVGDDVPVYVAAPAQAEPVADAYAWLVELFEGDGTWNSAGCYHTGVTDLSGHSVTTTDPYKARRYDTREHAERAAEGLGATLRGTWKAVQHAFAQPQPAQAEPAAPTLQSGACHCCGKWRGAHATLPGQPTDHLCKCAPAPAAKPQPVNAQMREALKRALRVLEEVKGGNATDEEGAITDALDEARAALVAADAAQPVALTDEQCAKPHFAYSPDNGVEFFKSHGEAMRYATESLDYYRDAARFDGEWPGDVDSVKVGVVTHKAVAVGNDADGFDYRMSGAHGIQAAKGE